MLRAEERVFLQQGRRVLHRRGLLSPRLIVELLLYQSWRGGHCGYRRMLDGFWEDAACAGVQLPSVDPVSAQAFSQARRKLPSAVVHEVLLAAAQLLEEDHGSDSRWHGRRLLAVDGAQRHCRSTPELIHAFGRPPGAHYPGLHVTALYDVIAETPVDAVVGPAGSDERGALITVSRSLRPADVVVGDRGYPSFDVFAWLISSGVDFVMRLPLKSTFGPAMEFLADGKKDAVVELKRHDHCQCPAEIDSLQVRLVHVERDGDTDPWLLVTSLSGEDFGPELIAEAYTLRWRVEEFFKLLAREYMDQEMFHSKCADGVRQEVFAQMTLVVMARAAALAAATAIAAAGVPPRRLSLKATVLAVGGALVRLLRAEQDDALTDFLGRLVRRLAREPDVPRPGRSARRRSLLPRRKWDRKGRRSRR